MIKRRKLVKNIAGQKVHGKSVVFWIISGLLLASSVFTAISTATSGAELSALQKKEMALIESKRILSHNLASRTSLFESETKSLELGFNKPVEIIYLTGENGVAKLP